MRPGNFRYADLLDATPDPPLDKGMPALPAL